MFNLQLFGDGRLMPDGSRAHYKRPKKGVRAVPLGEDNTKLKNASPKLREQLKKDLDEARSSALVSTGYLHNLYEPSILKNERAIAEIDAKKRPGKKDLTEKKSLQAQNDKYRSEARAARDRVRQGYDKTRAALADVGKYRGLKLDAEIKAAQDAMSDEKKVLAYFDRVLKNIKAV